jgi:hypothetical protein
MFRRSSLAEFQVELGKSFRDPKTAADIVAGFALPPEQAAAMTDFYRSYFTDSRFINRIALELYQHQDEVKGKSIREWARAHAARVVNEIQGIGFTRLTDPQISTFFEILKDIPSTTTPAACARIYSDDPDGATLEIKAVAGMGAERFEEYLTLRKTAILIGLEFPERGTLSANQLAAGKEAFRREMGEEFSKLPSDEAAQVTTWAQDLEHAPPEGRCKTLTFIMSAAGNTPGDEGNWYRRAYMIDMANPHAK